MSAELLGQASAAAPNDAETRYHYAEALAKAGDKAKAKTELEAVLKGLAPFPGRSAAEALRGRL